MFSSGLKRIQSLLEILAFSGLWTALAAGALTWAGGVFLSPPGGPPQLAAASGLAFAGTLVVYSVDRLRDVDRDHETSPKRSAFVRKHRTILFGISAAGLLLALLTALALPPSISFLCAAIGATGLLHRRLKNRSKRAWLYVAGAWTGVSAGLPTLLLHDDQGSLIRVVTLGLCLILALGSNALASEQRGVVYNAQAASALRRSRRWATAAIGVPLLLPGPAGMATIGASVWLAAVFFRPSERYGLIALDGALLVGATLAVAAM
ncbi:MAG: hypothetical protein P8M78_05785 [Myxococcota bacterium]|nr:hypothetical protein [Myxococcota bacterium]